MNSNSKNCTRLNIKTKANDKKDKKKYILKTTIKRRLL